MRRRRRRRRRRQARATGGRPRGLTFPTPLCVCERSSARPLGSRGPQPTALCARPVGGGAAAAAAAGGGGGRRRQQRRGSMAADTASLVYALQHTLSPDKETRVQAEAALAQVSSERTRIIPVLIEGRPSAAATSHSHRIRWWPGQGRAGLPGRAPADCSVRRCVDMDRRRPGSASAACPAAAAVPALIMWCVWAVQPWTLACGRPAPSTSRMLCGPSGTSAPALRSSAKVCAVLQPPGRVQHREPCTEHCRPATEEKQVVRDQLLESLILAPPLVR